MADLLLLRIDEAVELRFMHHHTSFEVRHVHFIRTESDAWREVSCGGSTCQHCLDGQRVAQRYIARVKRTRGTREQVLCMPHSLYSALLPHFRDKRYRVNGTTFSIWRRVPCHSQPYYEVKKV